MRSNSVHMEKGPIGKTLLAYSLPVLLAQLFQELYNLTDCMIVGHFGGEYALAAVSLGGLILSVLINFFIGFSSGVSVVTAELFGGYDYARLKRTLTTVFRLVIVVGIVISAAGCAGSGRILSLLKSPPEVLPYAASYLRICAAGLTAQLLYNVGTAVLRSLGDTKMPLLLSVVSVAANLLLDILFVIVLKRGVEGAAAATLASQWLLALLICIYLGKMDPAFSMKLRGESLSGKETMEILRMGIPAGLQALFMSISSLLIQVNINGFGPAAVAGMNVFAKIEGFLYLPTFSYGIALTGFVGQNYGAGKFDRIRASVRLSRIAVFAVILPLSAILTLLSPWILKLFTADPAILFNAGQAVLYTLPFYVIYSVNQVYLGAIKGLGDTEYPMICTLLCYSLFRVLWCRLLIPSFPTMKIVYFSYDVSFFLMLVLLIPKFRKLLSRRCKERL